MSCDDEIRFITCDSDQRIDKIISEKLNISRSFAEKLVAEGRVKINGCIVAKKSKIVKKGDILEVSIPPPPTFTLSKSNFPIEIIYEDSDYVVINKPAGIPVHLDPHHKSDTLVNILLDYILPEWQHQTEFSYEDIIKGKVRPGIIHRLDKSVSGVMIIAKNERALAEASEQFRKRLVEKTYIALCFGIAKKDRWSIDKPVGRSKGQDKVMWVHERDDTKGRSRSAITTFKNLAENNEFGLSLIQATPITGRTHQIRVHLCWYGLPIVKDEMYGGGGKKLKELEQKISGKLGENIFAFDGIFLHAFKLKIFGRSFTAKFPSYFEKIIKFLWPESLPIIS